jgi:hypothetical protein
MLNLFRTKHEEHTHHHGEDQKLTNRNRYETTRSHHYYVPWRHNLKTQTESPTFERESPNEEDMNIEHTNDHN